MNFIRSSFDLAGGCSGGTGGEERDTTVHSSQAKGKVVLDG
jgi:hypothetical protein